ncbi:MAG: triose-phosphate isomerase [Caldisericaceae bacterium]
MKKTILAGNWKMNKTIEESIAFGKCITNSLKEGGPLVIIFPPFTSISYLNEVLKGSGILLGAQNMHYEENGAFTGEISPSMLKDAGASYVLIGHSERRHIFGEDDELLSLKMQTAIKDGLVPVLCVGETLYERKNNLTESVISRQLTIGLSLVKDTENFVIAYEPVWAIGTGINATPDEAEEVHNNIRQTLGKMYGENVASNISILYGGSVKPDNIESLAKMDDIDGALVGGASLECETFLLLLEKLKSAKML